MFVSKHTESNLSADYKSPIMKFEYIKPFVCSDYQDDLKRTFAIASLIIDWVFFVWGKILNFSDHLSI